MPGTRAQEVKAEGLIAPRWHTATLVALYLTVATTGMLLQHRGVYTNAVPRVAGRISALYLPLMAVQWSLALYVCRVGRSRNVLRELLGVRWTSATRAAGDIALAAVSWALLKATDLAWRELFGTRTASTVTLMLPHTTMESLAWVLVSVSVGFCEEVVFRGYFQAQFKAFSGHAGVAVALQATLFGLSHGDQGAGAMARVALYGVGFGTLAYARRSLVPGILCHIWTDLASGLL